MLLVGIEYFALHQNNDDYNDHDDHSLKEPNYFLCDEVIVSVVVGDSVFAVGIDVATSVDPHHIPSSQPTHLIVLAYHNNITSSSHLYSHCHCRCCCL